jgi:hypothetical protein
MCSARNVMARKRKCDKNNYMILYSGHKSDEREFEIAFYISTHIMDNLLYFERINERICKIRVKL